MAIGMSTAALIAAGAGLGRGLASFGAERAKANAMFGDAQEDRLKELQRMEEMKALGLSTDEEQTLNRMLLSPVQAAQKEQFQRQAALMGQADSSGRALTNLMQQQEKEDRAIEKAAAQVAQADMIRAQEQEKEMRKLEAAESAAKGIKQASVYSLLGGTASGAADAYLQQQMFETMATSRKGTGTYGSFEELMGIYGPKE